MVLMRIWLRRWRQEQCCIAVMDSGCHLLNIIREHAKGTRYEILYIVRYVPAADIHDAFIITGHFHDCHGHCRENQTHDGDGGGVIAVF